MPIPKEVTSVKVSQSTRFTKDLTTEKRTIYVFHVGNHGPFSLEFGAGEDNPGQVEAAFNKFIGSMRELGLFNP